jgi:hypothetical protein
MVGAQGDVGARGLGQFAGRSRRSQSRRRNRQLTYYVCTDEGAAVCCECAESHYCSEGRGELDSLWLRARRPFSLAGWGLHLAHSGINNPNHYIGRAHAVWAGQTPQRCTVSLFPGRVPSRAMLARPVQRARCCEDAAAMGVSLSVHLSIHHTSRINIKVSLSPSTNLPIPSNDHICSATTKQTRSLITTTPPQSSPSLSSDAATPQLSKYFPPYCTLHPRNPTFPQPVHLPLRPFDSQLHSALTHQSRPRHSPARSE